MFRARHSYFPTWGYEANVFNDYGRVLVRSTGECSGPLDNWINWLDFPDRGYAWDFRVPCKAHDYCYDLRRASFGNTVSDEGCEHGS